MNPLNMRPGFSINGIANSSHSNIKKFCDFTLGQNSSKRPNFENISIVSRMMQERQLNDSFNTIRKANADIRGIPNARDYFDVIARHSPSLALDPMVAPTLIRQFDTFGGVDVNTVGKLREIQERGSRNNTPSVLDVATNFGKGLGTFKPGRDQKS